MNAAAIADSILTERRDRQRAARCKRALHPMARLDLRVSVESAELLDAAATKHGETIDVFVERTIREAAL